MVNYVSDNAPTAPAVTQRAEAFDALSQPPSHTEQPKLPETTAEKVKDYGTRLANNVRLIDLYARLKDYYKGIEIMAPVAANFIVKNKTHKDLAEYKSRTESIINDVQSLKGTADPNKTIELLKNIAINNSENKSLRDEAAPFARYTKLKTDVAGDLAFFGTQRALSAFSAWAEKSQVTRVYGDLANIEFGKSKGELKFDDLKKSENPMLRDAAEYYGKKSFLRSATDYAGLLSSVPMAVYAAEKKGLINTDYLKNTGSGVGKVLDSLASFGNGIKALMFAKTFFFQWYFSSRQTGSFYEAKNIWNKTEGVANIPNRALNENVQAGEFVTQQDIRSLYVNFREENPNMKLAEFTQDDPLASRIFEQTARYMNHSYAPKLFAINEKDKQSDLPDKNLSHAMLVELMGSGGLRVEDAIGSAIRLEVLATHGKDGVKKGIEKYREVSKILKDIPHPVRSDFHTQEEAIEGVRSYLSEMDKIGQEFVGKLWPPQYINNELKEGFIKTVFEGTELAQGKIDYMASAMFVRDDSKAVHYRPHEKDPASVFFEDSREQHAENQREAAQRESLKEAKPKFTDSIKPKNAIMRGLNPEENTPESSAALRA